MKAYNLSKDALLGNRIETAETFLSRCIGLLSKAELGEGEGLWISPCKSVHTVGMRFPIDVIFLDTHLRVIGMYEQMKPFRFSNIYFKSTSVLELPSGVIRKSKTTFNDRLIFGQ